MTEKKLTNPTKGEKRAYKDKLERGQGMNLDARDTNEINASKIKDPLYKEKEIERSLDGSSGTEYWRDERGLGSYPKHDDYGEESNL